MTRPQPQADALARLLEAEGAQAIRFPAVEIRAPQDLAALVQILERLAEFDLAIFISAHAVNKTLPLVVTAGGFPPGLQLACIGPGSARALAQFGYAPALVPAARYDSEALLALPPLAQMHGKNIVIFRGENGRELLGDTLRARGGRVTYAAAYRRVRPDADPAPLIRRWRQGEVDIVTLTSEEGLHNLCALLGPADQALLFATPAVVVSERLAQACRAAGFKSTPLIAAQASDEAILDRIKTWRKSQISL